MEIRPLACGLGLCWLTNSNELHLPHHWSIHECKTIQIQVLDVFMSNMLQCSLDRYNQEQNPASLGWSTQALCKIRYGSSTKFLFDPWWMICIKHTMMNYELWIIISCKICIHPLTSRNRILHFEAADSLSMTPVRTTCIKDGREIFLMLRHA